MALDDKEKRAAVLGVGRPWMRDKLPIATPDAEWRISSGNAYGAYIGTTDETSPGNWSSDYNLLLDIID